MAGKWKPYGTVCIGGHEVDALRAEAAPYADRLLWMDMLVPYQGTIDAPEDEPAEERDHAVERPLEAARAGELTTFPVHQWVPEHQEEEGSSSRAEEGAEEGGAGDGE